MACCWMTVSPQLASTTHPQISLHICICFSSFLFAGLNSKGELLKYMEQWPKLVLVLALALALALALVPSPSPSPGPSPSPSLTTSLSP